jgi:TPR repeat protein
MGLTPDTRLCLIVLLLPLAAVAQNASSERSAGDQKSFASIVKSPDIKAQAEIQQQSAKAAVSAAAGQPKSTPFLTTGPQIQTEADRQAASNRQVVQATSSQVIEKVKEGFPKFDDLGTHLRLGETITVSEEGKTVIATIRRLPKAKPSEQQAIVQQLAGFASAGVPEAVHFMGFLHETGMFNAVKNPAKAYQLYSVATSKRYAPSAYNQALMQAYGRLSAADSARAISLLSLSYAMARDTSGRVCGMLSFLTYRAGSFKESFAAAQGCGSPLANLARATDSSQPLPQRVTWLRDSLATGVDDGFTALAKVTRQDAKTDPNGTFCKYVLVAKHFYKAPPKNLRAEAQQCLNFVAKDLGAWTGPLSYQEQMVAGVSGFVPAEIGELRKLRQANRFRYSWPVPYLPFTQQEVELFESAYASQGFK